jgi:hypothetical protein
VTFSAARSSERAKLLKISPQAIHRLEYLAARSTVPFLQRSNAARLSSSRLRPILVVPPARHSYASVISTGLGTTFGEIQETAAPSSSEDSAAVRGRVVAARHRQLERFHEKKDLQQLANGAQGDPQALRYFRRGREVARECGHPPGPLRAGDRILKCRVPAQHRSQAPQRGHPTPHPGP